MRALLRHGRRIAGVIVLLAVASCGGGGAGGSGTSSVGGSTPASGTFEGVSVSLASPATIRDSTYEGLLAHNANLAVAFAGDLVALQGHTVYAKVVQSQPLFDPDPRIETTDGPLIGLTLHPDAAHPLQAGRMTGTLQVFVCLDNPDCSTQLRNSPLSVAFDVDVRPGLVLSTYSIQESTSYGTVLPPATVTVTPPAGANWDILPIATPDGAQPAFDSMLPPWVERSGNTLSFQTAAGLPPGVYATEFAVRSVVPDLVSPATSHILERRLVVRRTIVATGPYAMTPASEDTSRSLSAQDPGTPEPTLVSQVGGTFVRLGVRTDSYPAAAEGDPMLANWLVFFDGVSPASHIFNYCDRSVLPADCLPLGTYRGALLLRHVAPDGTQTDFEFPVTLTLTP